MKVVFMISFFFILIINTKIFINKRCENDLTFFSKLVTNEMENDLSSPLIISFNKGVFYIDSIFGDLINTLFWRKLNDNGMIIDLLIEDLNFKRKNEISNLIDLLKRTKSIEDHFNKFKINLRKLKKSQIKFSFNYSILSGECMKYYPLTPDPIDFKKNQLKKKILLNDNLFKEFYFEIIRQFTPILSLYDEINLFNLDQSKIEKLSKEIIPKEINNCVEKTFIRFKGQIKELIQKIIHYFNLNHFKIKRIIENLTFLTQGNYSGKSQIQDQEKFLERLANATLLPFIRFFSDILESEECYNKQAFTLIENDLKVFNYNKENISSISFSSYIKGNLNFLFGLYNVWLAFSKSETVSNLKKDDLKFKINYTQRIAKGFSYLFKSLISLPYLKGSSEISNLLVKLVTKIK